MSTAAPSASRMVAAAPAAPSASPLAARWTSVEAPTPSTVAPASRVQARRQLQWRHGHLCCRCRLHHRQYNRLWRLSDLQQQRQHRHLHPERGRAGESISGGSASCTTFGQVNVSGAATLGGTLSVELTNGCGSPSSTQSFQVMRHASHSGTFASVNTPTVNGRPMPVSYFPTNVTVGSTPQAKDLTVSTDRDPVVHAHLQLEHQEEC